jgi:ATP-dependent Zn protease
VLKRLEKIGSTIMNRASGGAMFDSDPVGAVLRNQDKKRAAAQILGQAYVTAYALMDANRAGLDRIADALVEHKELHGDEVGELLDTIQLRKPDLDLMNPATWPAV